MAEYFMTRYSLANSGIIERVEGEVSDRATGFVWVRNLSISLKLGRDVFADQAEAEADVRRKRDKKIAALKKQITKLERLEPIRG